jgi:hypothetical protein
MPQVGNQHFPYTPAGEAKAASVAKKSGKPLKKKGKSKGGKKYDTATNTFVPFGK